jgi:hypothetical protein
MMTMIVVVVQLIKAGTRLKHRYDDCDSGGGAVDQGRNQAVASI